MLEESIRDNRVELKSVKSSLKELTEKCNLTKRTIDGVKDQLDKKQDDRRQNQQHNIAAVDEEELMDEEDAPQEIIDEDELALLQRLKEIKKEYRNAFANLKNFKGQVNLIQQSIDQAKEKLVTLFEIWFEENFEEN